ncbi:hypothetical protein ACFQ4K_22080 [Tistrella bauzanensis]
MTAMPHPDDEPAPWSVGAYRRPRLVLDRVEAAGDGGLRIRRGAIMADLAPDGIDADVLAALLARLTDPDDGAGGRSPTMLPGVPASAWPAAIPAPMAWSI